MKKNFRAQVSASKLARTYFIGEEGGNVILIYGEEANGKFAVYYKVLPESSVSDVEELRGLAQATKKRVLIDVFDQWSELSDYCRSLKAMGFEKVEAN